MSKIVNVVSEVIEVLSNRMGEKLPLASFPTGEMMIERRRAGVALEDMQDIYFSKHTGWAEVVTPVTLVGVQDPLVNWMLMMDLAKEYDVPVAFILALDLVVTAEPARPGVYNRGPVPLVVDGKGTPALFRAAYSGADAGLWDAELLLLLPPPQYVLPMELLEKVSVSTSGEPDLTMA
jgi:hypothetical protein